VIGFTGSPLDRADALRLDEAALADLAARDDARLLRLEGLDPVIGDDGKLLWSPLAPEGPLIFLGLEGGAPRFAPLSEDAPGKPAFALFAAIAAMRPADAAIWAAARSVNEWHARHRYCGRCGAWAEPFRGGWGRRCTGCAAEHFPRVDPVVIMLAEHDGRVLLGRQHHYPPRRYSALAGFVEPGESIEEAVARELREEAGIEVRDVVYFASQPWPFPGQLMIACIAQAASGELVLDEAELDHAIWASRDEVRQALAGDPAAAFIGPPAFAIAHSLLAHWAGA